MKIVYLADAPYPHTWRWVRHFVELGHDCEVISFRPAEIQGARVHYVNGVERLGKARYLIHARRVRRLIESLRPDLVHALHLTSYGFLGALSNVHPFVLSVWGTDVLEAPDLTPFHRWLTRYALEHADRITATGLHLATATTRYAPRGTPVTVVPYGVDLEQFKPAERQVRDHVVIGAASRLSPEKGLDDLVDAFEIVRRRFGDRTSLRIAGEGPERSKLEAQIDRLGLGDAVTLAGWLEHDQLPGFLQDLDIFTLPSTWEGFGVSAVEASAMLLPVVGTNIHGIPDAVRDGATGLLVPPSDPPALAAALVRLIDDPALRAKLGAAGREYVAKQYDWHQNARQMERIYESMVKIAARG
jgi:glycosyltransferase involved in cell wall biosynthesis